MENEKKAKSSVRTKILTALLSVIVAFGLWLYVVTVVSPESENTYYNIPITLQNEGELEKRGLMITNESLPTVSLRLSGTRTDLQKLNNSNISIYVDVSKYNNNALEYTVVFPGDVPNNAITTLKRTPDKIKLNVEEKSSKPVGLKTTYEGTLDDNFSIDKENARFDFEEFQVDGPKRIVDTVAAVQVSVDLNGHKADITEQQLTYTLVDKAGQAVTSPLLEVYGIKNEDTREKLDGTIVLQLLRISKVKEIKVDVDVLNGGGATKDNVEVRPGTITISGPEAVIDKMGDVFIAGEIDLGAYDTDTTVKLPLELPAGVVCESGEKEIVVDLRFTSLITKALNVTNIVMQNAPEGVTAEVITKSLELRFRGPSDLIASLQASDITVYVDFADAQAGAETRPVTIVLADKYKDKVGVLGTYSVSTNVKSGGTTS